MWVNVDFIWSRVSFSFLRFIASLLYSYHSHSYQTCPLPNTHTPFFHNPCVHRPPPQTAASTPTIPCQARHTPKQDLLWLPLNYTPFYFTVYQSKGGASWGCVEGLGGVELGAQGPQYPIHQCRQPPQRSSWQGMSSYNAVSVPQSHPIPNCPQRWQIMGGLWSINGP